MRSSDWSSDGCSSDLTTTAPSKATTRCRRSRHRWRCDAGSDRVVTGAVEKPGVPMPGGGTALRISLVAALDRNRALRRGNPLPCHLHDDFRRSKPLTLCQPILMGSHTAHSLGRLPPRTPHTVL